MVRLPFRGDLFQPSRDRSSRAWRAAAVRYASRLGKFALFGPGALAAAGAANLVTKIPNLNPMPSRPLALLGKRKRNTRKTSQDVSGYIQLSRSSASYSRSLSQSQYMMRLLSSQVDFVVDRWQSYSSTGGANGSYWLSNAVTGAEPTRTRNLPVYTFELNSLRNNRRSIGPLYTTVDTQAIPMLRLRHTEATNRLNFTSNCYTYDPVGATGPATPFNQWQKERIPYRDGNGDANSPFSYAMVDWAEICIPIWGATTNPSSVNVYVCRFTDEDQQPLGSGYENGAYKTFYPEPEPTGDDPGYEKFQHGWATFTDQLNGCYVKKHTFPKGQLHMKVLKHQRFDFNPTANYENDTSGHQKIFKMFLRLNELTSYLTETSAENAVGGNEIAFDSSINKWPVNEQVGQNLPFCGNKKARLFLMITGQNAATDAGDSSAQCPSFDLMVRRRVSYLS